MGTSPVETVARPFLVELAGPPGAGKSTIYDTIRQRDMRIVAPPSLTNGTVALALCRQALGMATVLARRRALGRNWSRELLLTAASLNTLPAVIERERLGAGPVVFDQGPFFTLARPPLLDPRLEDWWYRALRTWQSLLDVVVWLDAPDDVLLARIDERSKAHGLKGREPGAAKAVLQNTRTSCEDVLRRLEKGRRVPYLLRFDTSQRSMDDIADEILSIIPPHA